MAGSVLARWLYLYVHQLCGSLCTAEVLQLITVLLGDGDMTLSVNISQCLHQRYLMTRGRCRNGATILLAKVHCRWEPHGQNRRPLPMER